MNDNEQRATFSAPAPDLPMGELKESEQYFDIVERPTTRQEVRDGQWMAPVLSSTDPMVDRRAGRHVHFFAEGDSISLCGNTLKPHHYVPVIRDGNETRPRCHFCGNILASVWSKPTSEKVPEVAVLLDEYSSEEFAALLEGLRPGQAVGIAVNRIAKIDDELVLIVEEGTTRAKHLRGILKKLLNSVGTVVIIRGEPPVLGSRGYQISWEIDGYDGMSPKEAAMDVWTNTFNRGEPGPDDACVFSVTDVATGEKVMIDLSAPGKEEVK